MATNRHEGANTFGLEKGSGLFNTQFIAVLGGRHPHKFHKDLAERFGIGIARLVDDFRDVEVGKLQLSLGFFDANVLEILDRRYAGGLLETTHNISAAGRKVFCDLFHRGDVQIIFLHVPLDLFHQLVAMRIVGPERAEVALLRTVEIDAEDLGDAHRQFVSTILLDEKDQQVKR